MVVSPLHLSETRQFVYLFMAFCFENLVGFLEVKINKNVGGSAGSLSYYSKRILQLFIKMTIYDSHEFWPKQNLLLVS